MNTILYSQQTTSLRTFTNQVKLLGVVLDEKLMLTAHVGALCKATYFHIRALCHIRKLFLSTMQRLLRVRSLVPVSTM